MLSKNSRRSKQICCPRSRGTNPPIVAHLKKIVCNLYVFGLHLWRSDFEFTVDSQGLFLTSLRRTWLIILWFLHLYISGAVSPKSAQNPDPLIQDKSQNNINWVVLCNVFVFYSLKHLELPGRQWGLFYRSKIKLREDSCRLFPFSSGQQRNLDLQIKKPSVF